MGAALTAGLAAAVLLLSPGPAAAGEPFLASTGGRGFLAEEEQALYNLRLEKEGEARREIQAEREKLESEARSSQVGRRAAQRSPCMMPRTNCLAKLGISRLIISL